jgi:2',3'-cyclic-nucleotide 2'-phosphodiesterase (5'-nucleotidase family)
MKKSIVCAVVAIWLTGCASQSSVVSAGEKGTKKVTLLHQSNRYGVLEPCGCHEAPYGGIDREANAVKDFRQEGRTVVYVDAGNLFARKPLLLKKDLLQRKAEFLTRVLGDMKLDAFAPGPGDYALDVAFLKKMQAKAQFPFVSTNVLGSDGKPIFDPFVVRERDGIRFGFLSLTPAKAMQGSGLKVEDPEATLKKWLPILQTKADFIVLLSQLGNGVDETLAKTEKDIRVIVGADESFSSEKAYWFDKGQTLVVNTADQGHRLGRLDIELQLPFKGFTSPEVIRDNQDNVRYVREDLAKSKGNKGLQSYLDRFLVTAQLAPIDGGSLYQHRLVPLDPEHFGKPNEVTQLLASEKDKVHNDAVENAR